MDRERGIQRYQSIDLLKFLCAFLVVCIHSPFPGVVGEYFVAISRIAVPVFFMITGFFYIDTVKRNQEKNQIIKILKIILFSTLTYFIYESMIGFIKYVTSGNIIFFQEVFNCFNYKKIINILIFNDSLVGQHLWYLNAIVYVLACSYLLRKKNLFKILYWAIPILLCLDLVFGKYSIAIFGRQFDVLYVRNFLCVGIPYFMIGNGIRHLAAKVDNQNMTKIKTMLLAAVIIFTGLCIAEKYIVISLGINAVRDHYISTTLLASAVFMLFVLIPATDNKIISGMSYIGKKYSLYIYIFHPLVITFFVVAAKILSVENLYSLFSPVIVFVVMSISIMIISLVGFIENIFNINDMSLKSSALLVLVFSLISGSIIGDLFNLEEKINSLADFNQREFSAFMDSVIFFGVGGMQICGPILLATVGKSDQLILKSIIDFPFAVMFGMSYGKSVSLSAIPVMLGQIAIALAAFFSRNIFDSVTIKQLCAMGYIILFFSGFNLICDNKYKVNTTNMIIGILIILIYNTILKFF